MIFRFFSIGLIKKDSKFKCIVKSMNSYSPIWLLENTINIAKIFRIIFGDDEIDATL